MMTMNESHATALRRPVEEHVFTTHDGVELFYRYWPAVAAAPRGAIVLFHRGHEHSGRVAHLADELNLPEFAFFAWDARGQGRSPGERGFSPSLATSVRDVQTFVDHIGVTYGIAPGDIAVVAQSVGAVLVATWAHDYAPGIRCMVLASPAFRVKLYVPFARTGLTILHKLRGHFFVNSYVKSRFLTHDLERIKSFDADPLIARPIAVNILLALYDTAERIVADARAITIPTQLLISGADFVVHHAPQHRFFERLGTPIKERHVLPGFYHDTLGEEDRAIAIDKARAFILERFAEPLNRPSLLAADRLGFTRDEADVLASPLPRLSPRGLLWAAARWNIAIGALFSDGLRLGRRTGFDSGSTLDYVYRNVPDGLGPLGRLVDTFYLESIGWRGIRQRKRHLEELLRETMASIVRCGMAIRVLDIAAGHGRYVLEAIEASAVKPTSVLLRDYSDINVAAGQALIRAKRLEGIATFVAGDAFDRSSLAAVDPKPTLGVVSGLYELFPDNHMVSASLAGLADAIAPGGYLIYTGQPWHPQLEMIARTLTSHRQGQAWIMRRRTQAEMDQLVAAAGFRKIEQRIDEWGIFTVSVAERIAP
jgi:alpha-beta hydrolase superfamily lysophospholipase/SAM-dependent methyltransferase